MTSQGTPQSRLQCALSTCSVFLAEIAVRELGGRISSPTRSNLSSSTPSASQPSCPPPARRWLTRLTNETTAAPVEIALAASALAALAGSAATVALTTLRGLVTLSGQK